MGGGGGIREHLEPLEGADVIVGLDGPGTWCFFCSRHANAGGSHVEKAAEPEPLRRIFLQELPLLVCV